MTPSAHFGVDFRVEFASCLRQVLCDVAASRLENRRLTRALPALGSAEPVLCPPVSNSDAIEGSGRGIREIRATSNLLSNLMASVYVSV